MIATILLTFGVLFVAELGDKSQLMALTFALRYPWWIVLAGIAAASVAVNLIAVGVGHFLGAALPTELIAVITGVILVAVGLWTVWEASGPEVDEAAEEKSDAARPPANRAFFVVLSAFLLAELGDRTMFATIALSSSHQWLAVWIGSAAGMIAAGGLAIGIGIAVGKHVPERLIGLCSGVLFLYIGAATLLSAAIADLSRVTEYGLALLAPLVAGGVVWAVRHFEVLSGRGDTHDAVPTDSPAEVESRP